MKYVPHNYQRRAQDFIITHPACGLFLGCGLGKTVIALTAFDDLKFSRFEVDRCLVIAPLKVAEGTWSHEAEKWDHLSHLRVQRVLGAATERERALESTADVYVINRENVPWLVEYMTRPPRTLQAWPFDMVIIDELSSFKSHSAKRFKALKAVRPAVRRIVGLTGTPVPNGLMDLWAQVYLLDMGKRLGRFFTRFREEFFRPAARSGYVVYKWVLRQGAEQMIMERISDICLSMKTEDYLDLPDMLVSDHRVELDKPAQAAYNKLEREMLLSIDSDREITATSAAALTNKLLQLGNGNVYGDSGEAHHVHDCKLAALSELLESLAAGGDHALVFYGFRSDVPGIEHVAKRLGLRLRTLRSDEDAQAWNRGEVDVLLAHPASCAYGLNLQDGGANVVYYSLPWSAELYEQANARLHRQGQTRPVVVHRLLVAGGVDEDVADALEKKTTAQDAMLRALRDRRGRL